jgi:sarcosine oxidase
MQAIRKDVIVVGLGGFGSAALWRLAERGAEVAGLERQGIGHHLGSSHGVTRLFRIACQEHPGLGPIALKSLQLWTSLGEQAGEALVRQTGCLSCGPPDSRTVRGAVVAAAAANVPVVELGHDELVERQPQYAGLGPDDVGVWDPGAGICYPERCIRAQASAARRLGAEIYPHTMARAIEVDSGGITVRTATVDFRASQVVIAAGAWLGGLVPRLPLTPRRIPQFWLRPNDPQSADFTLARFPAFIWQRPAGGSLWGHGSDQHHAVKVGLGNAPHSDAGFDPDDMDRYIHPDADIGPLAEQVGVALPGLDPQPVKVIPCLVTDSPDEQFLVGRPSGSPRLVVAGGDSGHGFKHAAGVGELVAQIVAGERAYCETGFLDPARFAGRPPRAGRLSRAR